MIRLSQRAPWNDRLGNPYRTRYAQVDGRRFKIEADRLDALWFVWEVQHDGTIADPERDFVAIAFNLTHARLAIQLRIDGKTEDEIRVTIARTPRVGTGRNHPRNVERRRGWRR
jgi:hypothetical protein